MLLTRLERSNRTGGITLIADAARLSHRNTLESAQGRGTEGVRRSLCAVRR
jgi:hypothetical protein